MIHGLYAMNLWIGVAVSAVLIFYCLAGTTLINEVRMVFMAISREQDAVAVGEYWADNGLTIPFSAQTDRTVYHLFAYSSIPRIYVVDASRIVRAVFTDSPLATSEDLTYEIERVLTEIKDTEK